MVDREVERWQQRAQLLEKQYAELAQIAQVVAVEEHVAAEHTLELTLEKACLHRARELVVR